MFRIGKSRWSALRWSWSNTTPAIPSVAALLIDFRSVLAIISAKETGYVPCCRNENGTTISFKVSAGCDRCWNKKLRNRAAKSTPWEKMVTTRLQIVWEAAGLCIVNITFSLNFISFRISFTTRRSFQPAWQSQNYLCFATACCAYF